MSARRATSGRNGRSRKIQGLDHTGGELDGPAYSRISCPSGAVTDNDSGDALSRREGGLADLNALIVMSIYDGKMAAGNRCFNAQD